MLEKVQGDAVVLGMINIEAGARIIEARLQPIKAPEFRLFKQVQCRHDSV